MKYHALFVIIEKAQKIKCRLLQIIGGAFVVKDFDLLTYSSAKKKKRKLVQSFVKLQLCAHLRRHIQIHVQRC